MNFFHKKNLSIKFRTDKGFALLFSVLVSSLLLTIGLSIFSIVLKEFSISTATRQSIHAFYAADSGIECIMYWDNFLGGEVFTYNAENRKIKCGSFSSQIDPEDIGDEGLIAFDTKIPDTSFRNFVKIDNVNGPNYFVKITKTEVDQFKYKTEIISDGFDSLGDDRVNRTIIVNY